MKKSIIVICCIFLVAAGPIRVSSAHADDLEQVLKRLAALERENTALRDRVRRLEGKRNVELTLPSRVTPDAKLDGRSEHPQGPYAAVYKAPAARSAPSFTWTGVYVGGHIGWGWQLTSVEDPFSVLAISNIVHSEPIRDFNSRGVLGGVQSGWNYQIGQLVVGSEVSISLANVRGSRSDALSVTDTDPFLLGTRTASDTRTWSDNTNWLATATTRFGYDWDGWLLYTKGGLAITRNTYNLFDMSSTTTGGAFPNSFFNTTIETSAHTQTGLLVGAGIEWALLANWSAVGEYNYMNLGSKRVDMFGIGSSVSNPGGQVAGFNMQTNTIEQTLHVIKLGLNYRFSRASDSAISNY